MNREKIQKIFDNFYDREISDEFCLFANYLYAENTNQLIKIFHTLDEQQSQINSNTKRHRVINAIIKLFVESKIRVTGIGLVLGNVVVFENNMYEKDINSPIIHNSVINSLGLRDGDQIYFFMTVVNDTIVVEHIINKEDFTKYRINFNELCSMHSTKHICLERSKNVQNKSLHRIIDIFSPISYGNRAIIAAPPKAGKTSTFFEIARVITEIEKNIKVVILLIDERPEEITEVKEKILGVEKIFSADFSVKNELQASVANLAMDYCKRLVEKGEDVMLFMDSLTRFGRIINSTTAHTGRTLTGGIEQSTIKALKVFLGNGRFTKHGSLGIITTCLYNTGSKLDDITHEEIKGTSNIDVFLDKELSERGIFPCINLLKTSSRKQELIVGQDKSRAMNAIRERVAEIVNLRQAHIYLSKLLASFPKNDDLFRYILSTKNTPS